MNRTKAEENQSAETKYADIVFTILSILFVIAAVIIVGCNLYRVFIICTEPVPVECIGVQQLDNEVTWSGTIDGVSYTWVEERANVAIGDISTIYISNGSIKDGAAFTTDSERLFWVIVTGITLLVSFAVVCTFKYNS